MLKICKVHKNRISQGDILQNIEYIEYTTVEENNFEISKIEFPYSIVISQDCDLLWNYDNKINLENKKNHDKLLISVRLAPLYNYDQFIRGDHLSFLDRKMRDFGTKENSIIKDIKNNTNPRYHFLEFPSDIDIVNSIIDFKHYFSVNSNYIDSIYNGSFLCNIDNLFREQISQRFAYYLSRIGLPEINET
jgi:hypothetical protein